MSTDSDSDFFSNPTGKGAPPRSSKKVSAKPLQRPVDRSDSASNSDSESHRSDTFSCKSQSTESETSQSDELTASNATQSMNPTSSDALSYVSQPSDQSTNLEDDPLSDVYSSDNESRLDSNESGDEEEYQPPVHDMVTVTNPRTKVDMQIDITLPSVLLAEYEHERKTFYKSPTTRDACLTACIQCTCYVDIVHGGHCTARLAQTHVWTAKVYWERFEYASQTLQHAQKAIDYLRENEAQPMEGDEEDHLKIIETSLLAAYLSAKALIAQRSYKDAKMWLAKADQLMAVCEKESNFKSLAFWMSETLAAKARVAILEGKWRTALRNLGELRRRIGKKYGKHCTKVAAILVEIALCDQQLGNHQEAIDHLTSTLKIYKSGKSAETSSDVAEVCVKLAFAYAKSALPELDVYVDTYFEEAVGVFRMANDVKGELGTRFEHCKVLKRIDKHDEAVCQGEHLLEDIVDKYGASSLREADVCKLIAEIRLQQNDTQMAVRSLRRVLHIEKTILGSSHTRTRRTEAALATLRT